MIRNGKIARLSHTVRTEINEQLRNGRPGVEIIAWLNRLTTVQEVLREFFDGRPINDQNLTEWKAGGYQDWLRHLDTQETVREWISETDDTESIAGNYRSVADCLSTPLAIELRRCLQETSSDSTLTPKERREAIIALVHASTQLRRANQSGIRMAAEQERKDEEQAAARERELEEKQQQQLRAQAFEAIARQHEEERARQRELEAQWQQQREAEARQRHQQRPAAPKFSEPPLAASHPVSAPVPANPPNASKIPGSAGNEVPAPAASEIRVIQTNSNQFKPEIQAAQPISQTDQPTAAAT